MEPVNHHHWVQRTSEFDSAELDMLRVALGITPLTARILFRRGIMTPRDGRDFLQGRLAGLPDPFLMAGMEGAVERLVEALENGERIAVHGDYDVDGITGTTLLVENLRAFGGIVDYHIPLRLKDGYGLSAEALKEASACGAGVVLSVDCGVSAVEEAELAADLGLDLIITDHHQPPDILPSAHAIINPHLPGCRFPFKGLAGVGVAFFLLIALRQRLRTRGAFIDREEPDLRHSLDLVALGTIADIVPLQGVNRLMAKVGLGILAKGDRPGVQALKEVAAVKEVTCGAVGFRLAPRLNAAGRLEDAAIGVQLLLERDYAAALEMARHLDGFNRQRQKIELETLRQAIERLEEGGEGGERSIVLADERWHPGVIGIVASRLVERYHRPVVLVALQGGQGKGSARSIPGFHLYKALGSCREHLAGFGGHEFAAGLTIAADRVTDFAGAFDRVARALLSEDALLPRRTHDGELLLEELDLDTVRELAELAPFGAGNPEPAFVASGVRVQQLRPVGEDHLRFTARQGGYSIPCIAFGSAGRQQELQGEIDLLFIPSINSWRGDLSVQLRIRDFRPTQSPLKTRVEAFPSAGEGDSPVGT
jgi:single-stranded-DNA-specific exonuclease